MFKSQFAREIQQISSINEELFASQQQTRAEYENSPDFADFSRDSVKNAENEFVDQEWTDGVEFKKFLDQSEGFERGGEAEGWEGGGELGQLNGDAVHQLEGGGLHHLDEGLHHLDVPAHGDVSPVVSRRSRVRRSSSHREYLSRSPDMRHYAESSRASEVISPGLTDMRQYSGRASEAISPVSTLTRQSVRESRPSEVNTELEEIWETDGGAKVSELSKIFESAASGGSEKLNFGGRRSSSSRPSSRAGSRPSSTPRSLSNPSSRPSSRFSMVNPEAFTSTPSQALRPMSKSTPKQHQNGHFSSHESISRHFSSKESNSRHIFSQENNSRHFPSHEGSLRNLSENNLRHFSNHESNSRHSPRIGRSKPNFKLEPYSPISTVNEISKVETVLSLGEQLPWTRRDSSLEIQPWRESTDNQQQHLWNRKDQPWQRKESSLEELEGEVQRLKQENSNLVSELEAARESGVRYFTLEKELDQLHWQLSKMEDSRKVYERATNQLVNFLDIVSEQLTTNSPSRSESRQSFENSSAFLGGSKTRSSFGGNGAVEHLFSGAPTTCRYSFGGSSASRMREGSRLSLGLGSGIRDIQRELHTLRALREMKEGNRERYHSARNLNSSRLSLGPSEINSRLSSAGLSELPSRSTRQLNLGDLPRSRSAMTISGISEDEPIETYSRQRRRRKTRFKDVIETSSQKQSPVKPPRGEEAKAKAELSPVWRREEGKAKAEVSPVWRREEGSEGGNSLESKDSGRSTDSCSSGRSSPKHTKDRDQLASRAKRMVNAVRHFLAKEKSKFPESNKQAMGDPWVIKQKETPAVWSDDGKKNKKSVKLTTEDDQEENPGRVVIRIRPEKNCGSVLQNNRNEVNRPETGKSAKREEGKRKSYSFSHPSVTSDSSKENVIKITKMGTVSVPVPYPVSQETQWF